MKLKINDTITWSSAAGKLTGTITNIVLSENAAGDTVAWLDVSHNSRITRLCGIDMNLKMLKVQLVDTNLVERTNIMTGKKFFEPKDTPVFLSPACETFWSM